MGLMRNWQKNFDGGSAPAAPAKPAPGAVLATGTGVLPKQQLLALLDGALEEDLKGLSAINSVAAKVKLKKDSLVPKYAPYVDRLRENGWLHELLTTFMLWLFDIGNVEGGLDLGLWCIKAGAKMPERFSRDVPCVIADAVLEWASDEQDAGRSPEPYFSTVFARVSGSDGAAPWDLPDKLTAKFYKLAGLLARDAGDLPTAQTLLQKALDMKAPVKTALAEVTKKLEAAPPAAGQDN